MKQLIGASLALASLFSLGFVASRGDSGMTEVQATDAAGIYGSGCGQQYSTNYWCSGACGYSPQPYAIAAGSGYATSSYASICSNIRTCTAQTSAGAGCGGT